MPSADDRPGPAPPRPQTESRSTPATVRGGASTRKSVRTIEPMTSSAGRIAVCGGHRSIVPGLHRPDSPGWRTRSAIRADIGRLAPAKVPLARQTFDVAAAKRADSRRQTCRLARRQTCRLAGQGAGRAAGQRTSRRAPPPCASPAATVPPRPVTSAATRARPSPAPPPGPALGVRVQPGEPVEDPVAVRLRDPRAVVLDDEPHRASRRQHPHLHDGPRVPERVAEQVVQHQRRPRRGWPPRRPARARPASPRPRAGSAARSPRAPPPPGRPGGPAAAGPRPPGSARAGRRAAR